MQPVGATVVFVEVELVVELDVVDEEVVL